MNDMDMIIAVIVLLGLGFTAVCQVVRNFRYRELADGKTRMLPWILLSVIVTVACDLWASGNVCPRLIIELSLGLIPASVLTSSLWTYEQARPIIFAALSAQCILAIYYIMCVAGLMVIVSGKGAVIMVIIVMAAMSVLLLSGIWRRIRAVKTVMKSGTVWVGLCLCVDIVYVTFLLTELLIYIMSGIIAGSFEGLSPAVMAILYASALVAMSFRIICDSAFVLMHRHERRIVESLKVSQIEVTGDSGKDDYLYREIYDRVVDYFENKQPYLRGDLTINDLVKVLYSNKLYISKAISHFTGRNFCQFVNYYRVAYSIEKFRANPELKVLELSTLSGFNSMVSYTMAFRLFMGETPSEWCRKEKSRIVKERK